MRDCSGGYTQQIVKFELSHVLLVDTTVLGMKRGESVLMATEKLTDFSAVSTHGLQLRIFCNFQE